MSEYISKDDAIEALNDAEDIKGYGYRQLHDALMDLPSIKTKQIKYFDEDDNVWKIGEVIVDEQMD